MGTIHGFCMTFEQILEAASHNIVAVRSLTSHPANYLSKTNKIFWEQMRI